MPPKKGPTTSSGKGRRASSWTTVKPPSEKDKNALANMFKRIQSSDQTLINCSQCQQPVKSCLMKDHLETKCETRFNSRLSDAQIKQELIEVKTQSSQIRKKRLSEELIVLDDENDENTNETETTKKMRTEYVEDNEVKIDVKQEPKVEEEKISEQIDEDKLLRDYFSNIETTENSENKTQLSPIKSEFDYYLSNFSNAIESVLNQQIFSCLFDQNDYDIIKRFSSLSNKSKMLYVRLFQRKFKWHCADQINYEQIGSDLSGYLRELTKSSFLIDESAIDTYEEIIYLFKLPQLKELAKSCHVVNAGQANTAKTRIQFIGLILDHFKTQKTLKFHLKAKESTKSTSTIQDSPPKGRFMMQCKKLLGKCWKLEKESRNLFGRILTLFSLSSTHISDPNKRESGQQQLMQMVLINLNKVKFMPYEIRLKQAVFSSRESLLRYHEALDYECELFSLIESKDLAEAHELFSPRIYDLQKVILDPDLNDYDAILPSYLRVFTAGSILTKILSIYAFEVLQKLKLYAEANQIFEFLLFKQTTYSLTSRAKWYERLAMNYEIYMKDPLKAFDVLRKGLSDVQHVKHAGRLALSTRLEKMAETKKYAKIEGLKNELSSAFAVEKYEFLEAPTVEIEGTLLHSEFIPGRKNVFIEEFSSSSFSSTTQSVATSVTDDTENSNDSVDQQPTQSISTQALTQTQTQTQKPNNKISPIKGVEQVALTHYIQKTNAYTHGKHAETATLRTLFGLVFWDILFDSSVPDVFVDRFQAAPLDLQTDYFYSNRKTNIDAKLELLENAPIEFICEIVSNNWDLYKGVECALVNWDLFETLEELLSLLRCFTPKQIHALCRHMSQNFRYCRSGGPDLVVWSVRENRAKFVEVKGPGDRLSYKQMVWLDFMIKNQIECEVCYVKGKNSKRLRESDE